MPVQGVAGRTLVLYDRVHWHSIQHREEAATSSGRGGNRVGLSLEPVLIIECLTRDGSRLLSAPPSFAAITQAAKFGCIARLLPKRLVQRVCCSFAEAVVPFTRMVPSAVRRPNADSCKPISRGHGLVR